MFQEFLDHSTVATFFVIAGVTETEEIQAQCVSSGCLWESSQTLQTCSVTMSLLRIGVPCRQWKVCSEIENFTGGHRCLESSTLPGRCCVTANT